MSILDLLGAQVRWHRKQLGFTQDQLAALVGTARSSIANIENGNQNVTFESLSAIAAALKTSVSALTSTEIPLQDTHQFTVSEVVSGQRKIITYRCGVKGCGTSGRISCIPASAADGIFALAVRAHEEEHGTPGAASCQHEADRTCYC